MRTSLIFALSVMCCQPALAECGTNGGPGYRNSSGKCVGWEALARQCGNPPTTKCTAEHVNTGSADAAASGAAIRTLMDRSHEMKKSSTDATRP
jgi:hypothetical protein